MDHHVETTSVDAGFIEDKTSGGMAAPIYLATTFERDADGSYPLGFEYSRDANPNRTQLERAMAQLEGGESAAAFASGSAVAMTLFQALKPGDHVVAPTDAYFGIRQMLDKVFVPWGLSVTYADTSAPDLVEAALKDNTAMIFVETPSNPKLQVTDIRLMASLARRNNALLVCDNTVATPVLQQPFHHGADIVIHSTTKYIGGHHDSMGGVAICRQNDDYWNRVRFPQKICGAIPSPFNAWLTLWGVSSLVYRMRAHSANGLAVARFLERHNRIEKVLYPGLESHAGFDTAANQMSSFGGLMSVLVRGDAGSAMSVAARVELFRRATSFGGAHSLIEHRASVEGPNSTTPPNLLRLAVGLENPQDLIADLEQALA
ncbi:MAG: aminotransferase class V-fold PLP-dependent enzyme [Candidatus Eremiobacteraeota bacterium]|nr:aminotransferase class V-fold PLP-dependent enzyme [Candidatus Eremiobacteraeota bacterium]MBC5827947.1 aminotransferase class V-fold PLP-dependent enzyme [Candidatus Eremiobacteraeota bacterium]